MRKFASTLVIGVVLALPCHAATLSIGPSIGFDIHSESGESFVIVTAPGGTGVPPDARGLTGP
jgi:hypothetical protein